LPSHKSIPQICEALEMGEECALITAPQVIISNVASMLGTHGLYVRGESIIFVSATLKMSEFLQLVITHELIHYLRHNMGIADNPCEAEHQARKGTAIIHNFSYDDTWREIGRYRCDEDT